MSTKDFLELAEEIRICALASGRDLNASNLFVHDMLTRALKAGARVDPPSRAQKQPPRAA